MESDSNPPDRGGEIVLGAAMGLFIVLAGETAFLVMLYVFVAWKLAEGSRVAYWLVSVVAFGWGALLIYTAATGHYKDERPVEQMFVWARGLGGLAVSAVLWFHRDVRAYLRNAGKQVQEPAKQ